MHKRSFKLPPTPTVDHGRTMFPIRDCPVSLFDRLSRRELLRIGGLSWLGLNSLDLARLRAQAAGNSGTTGQPCKSCVFVFLFGGPTHIDLGDMKPSAPLEIRGECKPVATKVPGIQICEHLPLLAGQIDKVCLLRSMTHRM